MKNKTDEYGMCPPAKIVALGVVLLFTFSIWFWQTNDTTDRRQDKTITENKNTVKMVAKELSNIDKTLNLFANKIMDSYELTPKSKNKKIK